jgi:hypothetical protein
MREYAGHKLNMGSLDGIARCQCNAWQWHIGPDLGEAYAGHIQQEQKREDELLKFLDSRVGETDLSRPSRLGKVGQVIATLFVFMIIMFTVMHFIGI